MWSGGFRAQSAHPTHSPQGWVWVVHIIPVEMTVLGLNSASTFSSGTGKSTELGGGTLDGLQGTELKKNVRDRSDTCTAPRVTVLSLEFQLHK